MMIDILEEHLEELSWIFDVRAHLLCAYHATLEHLAAWDERWIAHVDGLVLGGSASRPILEHGLDEGDDGAVCGAAAVLACWGAAQDRQRVEAALIDPDFAQREAFVFGLCLAPVDSQLVWTRDWLKSSSPALTSAALSLTRFRGMVPPLEMLRQFLRPGAQPPEVVRAAIALVGRLKVAGCNALIDAACEVSDRNLRRSSLEAAVLLGLRGARERLSASVRDAGTAAVPEDLERLGACGNAGDFATLAAACEQKRLAAAAIRGLGWLGHPAAGELLIAKMSDTDLGRLAGRAFFRIFGYEGSSSPAAAPDRPAQAEDDEAAEIDPFEGLPSMDPAAAAGWWKANAARFPRTGRWRGGISFGPSAARTILADGPLAERPGAALELALVEKDAPLLETCDLASRQSGRRAGDPGPQPPAARPEFPISPVSRERPAARPGV